MPEKGFNDGRVYISKTIIKIIKDYYKLEAKDFLWYNSKLPDIIIRRSLQFKLAGAIAFIVDEAHIGRNNITINSSNRFLLSQIRDLLIENNILCGEVKLKIGKGTTKDSFRFNVLKESMKNFVLRVNELKSTYPTCNSAQKEEKIMKIIS